MPTYSVSAVTTTVINEKNSNTTNDLGTCARCNTRKAAHQWIGGQSALDYIRSGAWTPYCNICALEEQLAYARKEAARIPDLERQLADALAQEKE